MAEEDLSPDGLQLVTQGSSNKLSKTVGKATEEDTEANENKSEVNEPIDLNAAFERRESVDNRTENSLTPGNDLLLFGRISEEQEKRNESLEKAKESVRFFAEHPAVVIALSILTLWALYHNDIRVAEFDKDADEGFVVVISITFFLFLFEIIATIFYKPGYLALPDWPRRPGESHAATWIRRLQFGDFFFWLDLVATLSLILEMPWIIGSTAYNTVNGVAGVYDAENGGEIGTESGRVVRLIRMIRLVRMVKLYKYASILRKIKKTKEQNQLSESRVGAAMSDLTNRKVVVLILLMLFIIPLLTLNDPDVSLALATQIVHQMAVLNQTDPSTYESGLNLAIETTIDRLPTIAVELNDVYVFERRNLLDSLRVIEKLRFQVTSDGFVTQLIFDQREEKRQESIFSMITTTFVICLLVGGTFYFSSDVNRLVIGPIERLVELVQKISANPLGVEYKTLGAKEGFLDGMETTILLTTITKIGGLMRVGFGEAGASIIAKNLQDSTSGRLNLMGSGTLIHSIFGFCDVRQFTDTTECLQEEVMLFVNRIAHILHGIVVQCSGSANKNIGDAFLLTWKLDDKLTKDEVASLADQALLAFLKSLIELSRHQEFICNFSVAATARLYKRFPEYAVRIGCGLHVGWAIEGAIGSNRKIDASYLSPHVNTTEYLESSTKQYGVPLLMSEPFFKLLSPSAARFCRQIDRVRRSDAEEPFGLYVYDADMSIDWNDENRHIKRNPKLRLIDAMRRAGKQHGLSLGNRLGNKSSAERHHAHRPTPGGDNRRRSSVAPSVVPGALPNQVSKLSRSHTRRLSTVSREEEKDPEKGEAGSKDSSKTAPTITLKPYNENVWMEDDDIVELRVNFSDNLRAIWVGAITAYVEGRWDKAKEVLSEIMVLTKKKDGPAKFLLLIINKHGGKAPEDWQGYRND